MFFDENRNKKTPASNWGSHTLKIVSKPRYNLRNHRIASVSHNTNCNDFPARGKNAWSLFCEVAMHSEEKINEKSPNQMTRAINKKTLFLDPSKASRDNVHFCYQNTNISGFSSSRKSAWSLFCEVALEATNRKGYQCLTL